MSIYTFVFLNGRGKVSQKCLPSLALYHQNFSRGVERTVSCVRMSVGKSSAVLGRRPGTRTTYINELLATRMATLKKTSFENTQRNAMVTILR